MFLTRRHLRAAISVIKGCFWPRSAKNEAKKSIQNAMLLAQTKSCDLSCDQRFKADAKPYRVVIAVFFPFSEFPNERRRVSWHLWMSRGVKQRELLTPGIDRALHGAWSGARM